MYTNVVIGNMRFLCVTINDRTYILGATGQVDWCQRLNCVNNSL